jgi:hypothetical protein
MAVAEPVAGPVEQQVDKGLKAGALGLVSTTIIATASVAPAYSIAATLVFVVGAVALQSPAVAVLAFVPMLLTSIGYGLTGFACTWYYRRNLTSSARNLWMQGILPSLGGLILFFLGGWSVWLDYDVATANDYTMWTVPIIHWQIGGAFVIAVVAGLIGVAAYLYCRFRNPAFFQKQTLTRSTQTLVPEPDA